MRALPGGGPKSTAQGTPSAIHIGAAALTHRLPDRAVDATGDRVNPVVGVRALETRWTRQHMREETPMSDRPDRGPVDPDTGLPAEPSLPEPSVEEPDPDLRIDIARDTDLDEVPGNGS